MNRASTTDVYFVGGSSFEIGKDVGSVQVSTSYFRCMKAPANNLCTYTTSGFVQFDCATSYIDAKMMRLVVESAMSDASTWGHAEYKACTTSSSKLKATTVETSCTTFEFTSLEATTLTLDKVPINANINGGNVNEVKCTACVDRSVLFLTTTSDITLGRALGSRKSRAGCGVLCQRRRSTTTARTTAASSSLTAKRRLTQQR